MIKHWNDYFDVKKKIWSLIEVKKEKLLRHVRLFATPWADWTQVSRVAGRRFTIWATREDNRWEWGMWEEQI